MSLFSWIITTYLGAMTLTCNIQPLPQPPTYTAEQSAVACLVELNTGASKRFWLFSGWFVEMRQWGGDARETY